MLPLIINLASTLIYFYTLCVIAWAIISTLISFNILNRFQPIVRRVMELLDRMIQPALRPIQRFMPDLGGLDISPIVLIMLLGFFQQFIVGLVDARYAYLALVNLISGIVTLYTYCVGIFAVLGALIAFKLVNPYQPLVQFLISALRRLCDPLIIPIRKFSPPIGRLDIAPFILLLVVLLANRILLQLL